MERGSILRGGEWGWGLSGRAHQNRSSFTLHVGETLEETHFLSPTSSGRHPLVALTPSPGLVALRQTFVGRRQRPTIFHRAASSTARPGRSVTSAARAAAAGRPITCAGEVRPWRTHSALAHEVNLSCFDAAPWSRSAPIRRRAWHQAITRRPSLDRARHLSAAGIPTDIVRSCPPRSMPIRVCLWSLWSRGGTCYSAPNICLVAAIGRRSSHRRAAGCADGATPPLTPS